MSRERTFLRSGLALVGLLVLGLSNAQAVPQSGVVVVRGGTVHTLAGDMAPIADGVVVIENGRITAVGGADTMVPAGAEIVDATGQHVYPGFLDAVTTLGLTEIGAVAVTSDFRELGDSNPHLEAATAVHPASEIIPVTRANGVTHAVAAPSGQGISGKGSLIHLDGWTVEEMLVDRDVYMVVAWPSMGGGRRFFRGPQRSFREAKEAYDEAIANLETIIADARRYAGANVGDDPTRRDLRLEAMIDVVSGDLPLLVNVRDERGIRDAVEFGERNDVRIILAGAAEAYKVADFLAEKDVPVILGATQAMPPTQDDPYDAAYAAPGILHAAGVRFAISTFNASAARTLPYEASQGVPYGLPREAALRAITSAPAEILGLGDEIGTLEPGKIANLFVTNGDPLDINTQISHLVVNGRVTDLDNKHDRLYQRYRGRPMPAQR